MNDAMKVDQISDVVVASDGSAVVVRAEVVGGGERTEVEIAIATELAPKVAIALLATTAIARASRDTLTPALDVLAAAVVGSSSTETVRMHLLFERGAVLPLELPVDAAQALHRALGEQLAAGSSPSSSK